MQSNVARGDGQTLVNIHSDNDDECYPDPKLWRGWRIAYAIFDFFMPVSRHNDGSNVPAFHCSSVRVGNVDNQRAKLAYPRFDAATVHSKIVSCFHYDFWLSSNRWMTSFRVSKCEYAWKLKTMSRFLIRYL